MVPVWDLRLRKLEAAAKRGDDETLTFAQEILGGLAYLPQTEFPPVGKLAAAYIEQSERMRKIAREIIAASQSIERGEVPLQKLCLIFALTKGPTE